MMISILAMSSQLVLILLVGRSVSMNFPQSSPRLSYRGNDLVMGIEGLPHLPDEEAGMAIPRTVMPTLPTQSGIEPSSHHQGGGSELVSIRIDPATEEPKTGLDRAQSEKQTAEAQAVDTSSNGPGSIQMAKSGSTTPEPKECSICLSEIQCSEPSQIQAWHQCGHEFHRTCIEQWKKHTCPYCREIDPDRIQVSNRGAIHSDRIQVLYQVDNLDPSHHIADVIDHQVDDEVQGYRTLNGRCLCQCLFLLSPLLIFGAILALDHSR